MDRKVFEAKGQTVINNDCLLEMKSMPEASVDVVVTSPPYNIGIKYNSYEDDRSWAEFLEWCSDWMKEIFRLLKPNGSFFLNVGSTNKNPWIPTDIAGRARNLFVLQNDFIWVKSISIRHADEWKTHGHFKPINSKRYVNHCYEHVFHFTKTGEVEINRLAIGVPYSDKSNINRWKHDDKEAKVDLKCRGNIWHIPYKTVTNRKSHPAGYPVELVETCLKLAGANKDSLVLDPFLGAGTTLRACANLELRGMGIELDEEYCRIALEQI